MKPGDLEGRLQVVRLFLESERYRDAGIELEEIIKAFPERKDLQQDVRELRQLGSKLILKEIQLRAKAGQHQLARNLPQPVSRPTASPAKRCSKSANCLPSTPPKTRAAKRSSTS